MPKLTADRVAAALSKVPEKKLLIIELANEMAGKGGEMELALMQEKQADVNLAIAEARAYTEATDSAVEALDKLGARAI
jgi:hydroxypyruvate isomerase